MPESEVLVSPPRTTSERGAPGKLGLIASPKTVRHPSVRITLQNQHEIDTLARN